MTYIQNYQCKKITILSVYKKVNSYFTDVFLHWNFQTDVPSTFRKNTKMSNSYYATIAVFITEIKTIPTLRLQGLLVILCQVRLPRTRTLQQQDRNVLTLLRNTSSSSIHSNFFQIVYENRYIASKPIDQYTSNANTLSFSKENGLNDSEDGNTSVKGLGSNPFTCTKKNATTLAILGCTK